MRLKPALDVLRDHHPDRDPTRPQRRIEIRRRAHPLYRVDDLRGLEFSDDLARHRAACAIQHRRIQMPDVEVDRVAEQQHLHQRQADDHPTGKPVAGELAHFLDGDRRDAPR